jgi:hypothetical protein
MAQASKSVRLNQKRGIMAATTMAETVALIGQKVDTVCTTVERIDANVSKLSSAQAATEIHLKSIIGPPSLEERVNKSMDDKDAHKHSNVMQAILGVQEILTLKQENATLKMEASIASVAESLKIVAKSVEHTEQMRQENHATQQEWQRSQEQKSTEEKREDAKWKSGVEKKLNLAVGAIIGIELMLKFGPPIMEMIKK